LIYSDINLNKLMVFRGGDMPTVFKLQMGKDLKP